MSNQYLKLRRSAVPGKVPDTASIDFGEIALNTYDGLAYMKVTGSFGQKVVAIGVTSGSFTGSLFGTASWAFNAVTASYALNAGTGNVSGSQYYVAVFSGSDSVITGSIYDSGSFTAIGATITPHPEAPERLFVDASDTDSYNLISGHGTINNYLQLNIKNFSSGISASSDVVATADNGDETSFFIDMGINSDGYNIPDGIGQANDAYLYSTGQDLLIGNASAGKRVIIFNGSGPALDNARIYINSQGTVGVNANNPSITNPEALLVEPLTTGSSNPSADFSNLIIGRGTVNESYMQLNINNLGTGSYASSDIVASNDISTETTNYVDMGINASTKVFDPSFGPGGPSDTYLLSTGNDLLIGSATSGDVVLWTGPDFNDNDNAKLILKADNLHQVTGSLNFEGGSSISTSAGNIDIIAGPSGWSQLVSNDSDQSVWVNNDAVYIGTDANTSINTFIFDKTGSLIIPDGGLVYGTASWALNSLTSSISSNALTSSLALTASSADNFVVRNSLTASNALITGTITAQTLVVQTVTSSIVYSSGSNDFGSQLTDQQTFTGSVNITGSLTVNGYTAVTSDMTGSMSVASASYAQTASYVVNAISASYVSGSAAIVTDLTSINDARINGLTVGKGNGIQSTVFGLNANTGSSYGVAIGHVALANATGNGNVAVGRYSSYSTTTGIDNVSVGSNSLLFNQVGVHNTAVGSAALNVVRGSYNIGLGSISLGALAIGDYNIGIGRHLSMGIVTGSYNTIIGSQITGLATTLNNNIILADGQGNIKYRWDATQNNIYGNLAVTGSVTATTGFTGSLFGTASWAENAITASYVPASGVVGLNLSQISTGSVTASVNLGTNSFNIVSSSVNLLTSYNNGALNHGNNSTASGAWSHTEGSSSWAIGTGSHAEGIDTFAYGAYSHTEGSATFTTPIFANILDIDIPNNIIQVTSGSFFEVGQNIAYVYYAGGNGNKVWNGTVSGKNGNYITASGASLETIDSSVFWALNNNGSTLFNLSSGSGVSGNAYGAFEGWMFSHAEGSFNLAAGLNSHAEGRKNLAQGNHSHAEGAIVRAIGVGSHAEGSGTQAIGNHSHAEGSGTQAIGINSHTEGVNTLTSGNGSHAEGTDTRATGTNAHSEGDNTIASGFISHAEGSRTEAKGTGTHAEGSITLAIGSYSHAEGNQTTSSGMFSHTEGVGSVAGYVSITPFIDVITGDGHGAHAEGFLTLASGSYSHTEGESTLAIGRASHAEGRETIASGNYQHVQGQYNISSLAQSAFIIGNGTSDLNRSNLVFAAGSTVQVTGSLRVSGSITGSLFGTASWAQNALTSSVSSNALTSSLALTASSADNFVVRNSLTASNALITGTITAQTLVVQTVSSSVVYSSGSNDFGSQLTDQQTFTGSVNITGSLTVNGNTAITSDVTASMSVASASFAQTASYAISAISSSYPIAVTGSTLYSTNPMAGIPSGISTQGSIFLGSGSGYEVIDANNSNFLGTEAGYKATFSETSNFIGYQAGYSASDSYNANFIGYQAGKYAISAPGAIFIGINSGDSTESTNDSVFIGNSAGYNSKNTVWCNFIGLAAGKDANYAVESNFIGDSAGWYANNSEYSNFIGFVAGGSAAYAKYSNFMGYQAGGYAISSSYSTLIGYKVGYNLSIFSGGAPGIGSNNIIIGTNITLPDGTKDSINLGAIIFATGSYSNIGTNPFAGTSNGRVGINQPTPIFNLDVSGTGRYTNGLQVTQSLIAPSITGSLFGTASWARNSITASFLASGATSSFAISASYAFTASSAISASYILNAVSSSYSFTASSAISASQAQTASYVLNAISSSYAFTASSAISSSLAQTASYVINAISASYALTASSAISASQAQTASYVLNAVSASYAFTASLAISSSYAFTASSAISASQAQTASYVLNAISASYAFTASSAVNSFTAISSSNAATASSADNFIVRQALTASNALITGTITAQTLVVSTVSSSVVYSSGSNVFGNSLTNTQVFTGSVSITGSLSVNGSNVVLSNQTGSMSVATASFAQTASYVLNAVSSSYAFTASSAISSSFANSAISSSYSFTASSAISASQAQTASYVINAISASYSFTASSAISASQAQTASYVLNAVSSSFTTTAATASFANSVFDIGIAEFNTTSSVTIAGTTIVSSINTGSFTSAFYNYTIASGSNARSGQVMSVWNGANIRYTEVTTMDIGNTATASFAVTLSGANVQLSFSAPGSWTVKSIANLL